MFAKLPAQYNWDYSLIADGEVRLGVKNRTIQIRSLDRQIKTNFVTLGNALSWVKDHLEHGLFGKWLKSEFDTDQRTAERLINLAKGVEQNRQIVELGLSVGYLLTAPTTPAEATTIVLADYEQTHNKPTVASVKATIKALQAPSAPGVVIAGLLPANVPSSLAAPVEPSDAKTERKWNPGVRVMCDGCGEAHADWIPLNGSRWSCRRCGVIRNDDSMEEWTPAPKLQTVTTNDKRKAPAYAAAHEAQILTGEDRVKRLFLDFVRQRLNDGMTEQEILEHIQDAILFTREDI